MPLDTLQTRGRTLALYERYGALLTEHQRQVLDLYLRNDWSLAEIASHQRTSRAAVHDQDWVVGQKPSRKTGQFSIG